MEKPNRGNVVEGAYQSSGNSQGISIYDFYGPLSLLLSVYVQ